MLLSQSPIKKITFGILALALIATLTACRNPDFNLSTSGTFNVQRGSSIAAPIEITRIDGFDSAITLSLKNPPTGVTAPSLTIPASANTGSLNFNVDSSVAAGTLELNVTGSALDKIKTTTLRLNVTVPTVPSTEFTIASQSTTTVTQGQNAILGIQLERQGGYNGAVTVDLLDPPTGISATPIMITPGRSSGALSVSVAANVAPSAIALTLRGVADGVTKTAKTNISVVVMQDFAVSPSTSSSLVSDPDKTLDVPITITRSGGFTESVQLTLEGEVVGNGTDKIEASFTPNPVAGDTSASTLQLKIGSQVAPKVYDLTLRGTVGGKNRTALLKLEVRAPLVVLDVPTEPIKRLRAVGTSGGVIVNFNRSNSFNEPIKIKAQAPAGIDFNISEYPTSVYIQLFATQAATWIVKTSWT